MLKDKTLEQVVGLMIVWDTVILTIPSRGLVSYVRVIKRCTRR